MGFYILRTAVEKAGLSAKGISTHSTRRSFITKLHRNGTDLYTIKKITGHKHFKALERYIEIDARSLSSRVRRVMKFLLYHQHLQPSSNLIEIKLVVT